ncbi:hypothetical protein CJF42_22020 [Pseudoalteromonas sp. NBT06-2]|uniref:hypothetical protein n=1 Tax=Pseudoalteromonas sp. NBT06-2 TaxID=2025950 RepID=UPI000BA6D489|nr:hypothetical protein [Pseudoalteromonas sp. NBT06-2]PAJ72297.1 hypothetical protein CJF42_22020 [Pseudoalteromonas sp. NBT06-2]
MIETDLVHSSSGVTLEPGSIIKSAQEKTEAGNKLFKLDGSQYLVADYPKTAENIESKYIINAAIYNNVGVCESYRYYRQKSADGSRLYLWDDVNLYESFDNGVTQSLVRAFTLPAGFNSLQSISMGKVTNILLAVNNRGTSNISNPEIAVSTDLGLTWARHSVDFGSITGRWTCTAISHDESKFWVGGHQYTTGTYTYDCSSSVYSKDKGASWSAGQASGGVLNFMRTNQEHNPVFTADNSKIIMAYGYSNNYISVSINGYYNQMNSTYGFGNYKQHFVMTDPRDNSVWLAGEDAMFHDVSGNGTNWIKTPTFPPHSTYNFVVDANGDMYISSGSACYQLLNGKTVWDRIYGTDSLFQNVNGVFFGGWNTGQPVTLRTTTNIYGTDNSLTAYAFTVPDIRHHSYDTDESSIRKMVGDIIV